MTSLSFIGWARHHLPARLVTPVTSTAGDVVRLCDGRRRRAAFENGRCLTGHDSLDYIRRLFRHFAYCNADLMRLPRLTPEATLGLIDFAQAPGLAALHQRTSGALIVGGHLGNFELSAVALAARGLPAAALVESIDPKRDTFFASLRSATGLRLFAANGEGSRQAVRWLRDGHVLAVAGDRPLSSPRSLVVPFGLGRRAIPTGPAWLALAGRATVTPGAVVRAPELHTHAYLGFLDEPIDASHQDDEEALTRAIGERLSAMTVRFADQWFVFDPAWERTAHEAR